MSLPKRFPDRDEAATVRAEAERLEPGQEAPSRRRLAGRVLGRRAHGKLVFLDLVDRSGTIQLLCAEDRSGPVDLNLGDIVAAIGAPARTRRGEPSLAVDELELLAGAARPLPDTYHGLVDTETRYRRRYLDLLVNEVTRRDFLLRSRMVSAIRRYLDDRGFVEVETPVLQPRYGGAFARPFVTHHNELETDLYLRIATELYLKRLIVGGLEKVYEIGKDFRNESISYKHQPEFTMLEWYEAYADYRDTMARIEDLVQNVALETIGTTRVVFRGHQVDLRAPWRRLRLVDALTEHDLWSRDEVELRARLRARDVDTSADRTWAQLVDHALSHFVEPSLIEPTILHDYPIELSPFARTTDDDPAMVERFEYYVGGMELGNAFTEINDASEQAERFRMQRAERDAGDALAEAGDPDFVEALSYGMPPTGGIGLGIDRLAMVLTGRETIRDVVLFPALREEVRMESVPIAFPSVWLFEGDERTIDLDWWREHVHGDARRLLEEWAANRADERLQLAVSEVESLAGLAPGKVEWFGLDSSPVPRHVAESLDGLGSGGVLLQLVGSLCDATVDRNGRLTPRGRQVATGLAALGVIRHGTSDAAVRLRGLLRDVQPTAEGG